ncbi:Domain of uncharacterised function (DUF2825) [Klebsiella quasipneumoniae]|nr:Domain of uncharacterised function (DUF2825) [Klebsiella quasipneumoniae]
MRLHQINGHEPPHACGEDALIAEASVLSAETPPRMWGRQRSPPLGTHHDRNTPTHVGKTNALVWCVLIVWKHPHARGEDTSLTAPDLRSPETPPRTWGRRHPVGYRVVKYGNTPTHVGKTVNPGNPTLHVEKHPHARGEDTTVIRHTRNSRETPPRTWGRLHPVQHPRTAGGNTPTHVGKTSMPPNTSS